MCHLFVVCFHFSPAVSYRCSKAHVVQGFLFLQCRLSHNITAFFLPVCCWDGFHQKALFRSCNEACDSVCAVSEQQSNLVFWNINCPSAAKCWNRSLCGRSRIKLFLCSFVHMHMTKILKRGNGHLNQFLIERYQNSCHVSDGPPKKPKPPGGFNSRGL